MIAKVPSQRKATQRRRSELQAAAKKRPVGGGAGQAEKGPAPGNAVKTSGMGGGKAASKPGRKRAVDNDAQDHGGGIADGVQRQVVATRKKRARLTGAEIAEIFRRFHDIEPAPKGELEHSNPYTLLVAVVLSAQATDAGVNKATRALFKQADTPEKMVALGEDRVRDFIKTIGLYRNKAKNVIALSEKLIAKYGGEVPEDRDALETLPGVGRKTANVVMNVAFGQPTMAVDTHVFRIANRVGLSSGKTPLKVEEDLVRIIPAEYGVPAHHWLILHGRYLCKARKPECYRCPIRELCRFEPKTPHA